MPNEKEMKLKTRQDNNGTCVRRTPSSISGRRSEIDVFRLLNDNPAGSGRSVSVSFDPNAAAAIFVAPPAPPVVLAPGKALNFEVKPILGGPAGFRFQTSPGTCTGGDDDDLIIHC